jgi:PAC2 family.
VSIVSYSSAVSLYTLDAPEDLVSPTLISALDGWVDSGSAATSAAAQLAGDGPVVATFDADVLFDYRARRPTLDIVDGRLAELTWPELTIRHSRLGERDLLVLTGAEPDFRWREFADAVVELVGRLGVVEWISLGAIPAAVPHTRAVPIMGTESEPGLLRANVQPGPKGVLRVPSAALSVLEMTLARAGTPAVGYFAQIPHYVSGPYAVATLALLRAVESHLGIEIPTGALDEEARQLRTRLDLATGADEATRAYVERLESMVDEERLPAGDELISEIERFLRDRGAPGGPGTLPN